MAISIKVFSVKAFGHFVMIDLLSVTVAALSQKWRLEKWLLQQHISQKTYERCLGFLGDINEKKLSVLIAKRRNIRNWSWVLVGFDKICRKFSFLCLDFRFFYCHILKLWNTKCTEFRSKLLWLIFGKSLFLSVRIWPFADSICGAHDK